VTLRCIQTHLCHVVSLSTCNVLRSFLTALHALSIFTVYMYVCYVTLNIDQSINQWFSQWATICLIWHHTHTCIHIIHYTVCNIRCQECRYQPHSDSGLLSFLVSTVWKICLLLGVKTTYHWTRSYAEIKDMFSDCQRQSASVTFLYFWRWKCLDLFTYLRMSYK